MKGKRRICETEIIIPRIVNTQYYRMNTNSERIENNCFFCFYFFERIKNGLNIVGWPYCQGNLYDFFKPNKKLLLFILGILSPLKKLRSLSDKEMNSYHLSSTTIIMEKVESINEP